MTHKSFEGDQALGHKQTRENANQTPPPPFLSLFFLAISKESERIQLTLRAETGGLSRESESGAQRAGAGSFYMGRALQGMRHVLGMNS